MRASSVIADQLQPFVGSGSSVHRLELDRRAPLYPLSEGRLVLKRNSPLEPGVYEVGGWGNWLLIDRDSVRRVSEAEALIALGAIEALEELGLGDAAISLEIGDLTNARYQWLRHRAGL